MKTNYVYILKCSNDSYYTGWTNDLEARVEAHNQGKGAKYTRAFGPCQLVYFETFETKSAALKREAEIKKMTRIQKVKLIEGKMKNE